jgi:hypothetical protein
MIKDMIDKQVMELKKLWANKRQLTFQLLNLAMIVFSALMIWKGLMFLTKVMMIMMDVSLLWKEASICSAVLLVSVS